MKGEGNEYDKGDKGYEDDDGKWRVINWSLFEFSVRPLVVCLAILLHCSRNGLSLQVGTFESLNKGICSVNRHY